MDNKELLAKLDKLEKSMKMFQKADSDGVLNAEQATMFIRTTIDQSGWLKRIFVEQMLRDKKDVSLIGLANRIMRKGAKDTDPDVTGATKGTKELSVVEFVCAFNVYFQDLEESIEQENYEATLTGLFSTQIANDMADLSINGDESYEVEADPDEDFINQNDGFLTLATADEDVHTDNYTSDAKIIDVFANMLHKMPNKWKTNKAELCYICSPAVEEKYRDEMGSRMTPGGDLALTTDGNLKFKGIEVLPVAQWPDNKIMLTKLNNLHMGWHKRYIRVGKFINERKRRIEYTISGKIDFQFAIGDMIVVFTNSSESDAGFLSDKVVAPADKVKANVPANKDAVKTDAVKK